MKRWFGAIASVLCFVTPALANAPDASIRPQARVEQGSSAPPPLRPQLRPLSAQVVLASAQSAVPLNTLAHSLRPFSRPPAIVQQAMGQRQRARRGMVCNDPQIQGEVVGMVPGRIAGCGIPEAVRIRSVSGVALSQQSLMDCTTARALNRWVTNGVKPALRTKGQVEQLRVAAHYVCRTRNHQPGARISEHGKGRAIDISGFKMADGEVITVTEHWNARGYRTAMRRLHETACGPFGTVLGPESDRFHQNHFHLDTAVYRSGPYCR